jgi:hypothetical protein
MYAVGGWEEGGLRTICVGGGRERGGVGNAIINANTINKINE